MNKNERGKIPYKADLNPLERVLSIIMSFWSAERRQRMAVNMARSSVSSRLKAFGLRDLFEIESRPLTNGDLQVEISPLRELTAEEKVLLQEFARKSDIDQYSWKKIKTGNQFHYRLSRDRRLS